LFGTESDLRIFLECLSDYALIMLDPSGIIVSWNEGAERIKGYPADEIVGRHFSCLYTPEDIAAGKPAHELEVAMAVGRLEDTGQRVSKDGSRFWAHVVIAALYDERGALRGFGKITRDITDRMEGERRLRASELRLRSLVDTVLDTIGEGLITFDVQGAIQSYNRASEALFGYLPEEVVDRDIRALIPDLELAPGGGRRSREVVGRRKDGSSFPLEVAIGETRAGERLFVAMVRDLTGRREVEEAREQLRQAQKMEALGQLTGGIAHDFNNLLAVILGNLDMLQEYTAHDEAIQKFLGPCMRAAMRGSELTQRLLAFGRRQALLPKLLSVNDLILHFTDLLHRTLGERIEIITALAPDLWPIKVDPGQLENALLNLALNARDAMPQGGKLVLETANVHLDEDYAAHNAEVTPGDYALVAVSDTGGGMTPDVVARAFEPFFTTKEVGRGSGLGLSMIYGFVKQSSGHIKIYSEVGKGTSIKIYLPRAEGSPSHLDTGGMDIAGAPSAGKCVLIVEDDKEVLALTAAMVESLGYTVLTAESGDAALLTLAEEPGIDALLTDVMLPGSLNGPALARRAVELRPELKVLFTSGYAEHAIIQSGVLEQGVNLISKPFRKRVLAERLANLIG
jgi:PAS domain S-box-containing protein